MRRRAVRALKSAAAAWDRLSGHPSGLVVLIYHRVGRRSDSPVDLPEWLFEEQIARIAHGPGALSLDDALLMLAAGRPPSTGQPPVVVTFDDGTADFVDVALPILANYRVPATLYVATGFIEGQREFPQAGQPLSWAALRDATATGLVTIGSHTHTHTLLDRADWREAADDLDRSIRLIQDRLGLSADHFAYPKALLATPEVEIEVRARFRSAALAGTRPNRFGATDPYRLARSPVQVDDGLRYFSLKLAGGMRLEDDIRRTANRRRLAGQRY